MPVTNWMTRTKSVAEPRLYHHVRPAGTRRRKMAVQNGRMPVRWLIHSAAAGPSIPRKGGSAVRALRKGNRSCTSFPPLHRLFVRYPETEVLVEDEQLAVVHLGLQTVERARRRTGEDGAAGVVDAVVAWAEESLRVLALGPPAIRAAQVRAAAVEGDGLVVLHADPDGARLRDLPPPVLPGNRERDQLRIALGEGVSAPQADPAGRRPRDQRPREVADDREPEYDGGEARERRRNVSLEGSPRRLLRGLYQVTGRWRGAGEHEGGAATPPSTVRGMSDSRAAPTIATLQHQRMTLGGCRASPAQVIAQRSNGPQSTLRQVIASP